MRQVDFSPFYRSTIGFDRLFTLFDSMKQPDAAPAYPPYNIERLSENDYRISMAVAGFSRPEIDIEARANQLTIRGEKANVVDEKPREFLYRGIASRGFERQFHLAEHVHVIGAELEDGLLHILLKREVPETMKPRKIPIEGQLSAPLPLPGEEV